jgi:hypothetical protein
MKEKAMRKKFLLILGSLVLMAAMVAACSALLPPNSGSKDLQSEQQTAVMETVQAVMTQQAFNTLVAQATQLAGQQSTPQPTPTSTQPVAVSPTATLPLPTATLPLPTATATAKPVPCNAVAFVKDVSIPDGTDLASGQKFTKTWRLENVGTCTWTTDYDLVFVNGAAMSGPVYR